MIKIKGESLFFRELGYSFVPSEFAIAVSMTCSGRNFLSVPVIRMELNL
jgi:hypothetical protein